MCTCENGKGNCNCGGNCKCGNERKHEDSCCKGNCGCAGTATAEFSETVTETSETE